MNVPDGVILPMPCCFVYQTLPSGPGVMAMGPMLVVLILYTARSFRQSTVMAPMALGPVFWCKNQISAVRAGADPARARGVAALTFGTGNS